MHSVDYAVGPLATCRQPTPAMTSSVRHRFAGATSLIGQRLPAHSRQVFRRVLSKHHVTWRREVPLEIKYADVHVVAAAAAVARQEIAFTTQSTQLTSEE